ncbi:hypothetical protein [Pseudomonas sp.]|uniref:hypothetical protein n=1 Tax=Pseudomonas sp. TaxID=306 RepID=UPI003D0D688B
MGQVRQGDFQAESGTPVSSKGSVPGWAAIIRAEIARSGKGVRELTRANVISERTRRNFYERLEGGLLSTTEVEAIFAYLKINPVKAMVAVQLMQNPMTYYDPACETLATMAEELTHALLEQMSALYGDFTPIHRNLCKVQAAKLAKEFAKHLERSKNFHENGFE